MEQSPPGSAPPSSPPPPPKPKDTRRHPRFEMFASVELHAGGDTLVLPARNISLGGIYLAADGHDLEHLAVGAKLEVLVFDALDETRRPVRLEGEVVRLDGEGVALMWSDSDADAALELSRLLDRLQPQGSEQLRKKTLRT